MCDGFSRINSFYKTERAGQQTCRRQQGCPCGDLPPSVLEGGAREAGGPGPHRGFLLPYTPGVQRHEAQRVSYRLSII